MKIVFVLLMVCNTMKIDLIQFDIVNFKWYICTMTTNEALNNIFESYSNERIAKLTGTNYNTVTSWKFNFKRNELSLEKQIEILTKLNYKPITNLTWKQN